MMHARLRFLLVFCAAVLGFSLLASATDQTASTPEPAKVDVDASGGNPALDVPLVDQLKERMIKALGQGATVWALLLAFMAGFLTSLMGCVYPLIPVVMAVIGTRETESKLGALGLSAVYVLGMCLLYTTLGLVFAGLGKAFGSWLGSIWVTGFIVAFFVAMGLAMAGVFELRLPAGLERRLNRLGGKGCYGAFLAGLVSGLVMAPCTGPVLSVVLLFIVKTQSFFFGFWLLFFLSLGTGILFLVVGTFSGIVAHLPSSGSWMEVIRSVFAMVIMGMALFFLKGILPGLHRTTVEIPALGWIGLGTLAVAGLTGGFHLSFPGGSLGQRLRKLVGLFLGAVGVFMLAVSLFSSTTKVNWVLDLEQGLSTAKKRGSPVMLDFWAVWCQACLDLDDETFSDQAVQAELKRFLSIKVDCTQSVSDEKVQKWMERYEALDLPTIRFIDKDGKLLKEPVVKGFVGADRMLKMLRSVP